MGIIESLKKHNKKELVSFHMPGHKLGRGFEKTNVCSDIWKYDTTELSDTDCLQNPKEFIKNAEKKAAEIYGAKHSFFLVNGSTCGILSMFFSCFKEGDKVIVVRDCHKSVINAMIFTGVIPIYVEPEKKSLGLYGGVNPKKVEEIFENNKDCKGIFVTSPSYYGIMSDIKKLSDIAHKYNALLLCDEAHGAHFPFSDKFPKSAIESGADLSVISMHKTMFCPNQTAILNLGDCKIKQNTVRSAINMFQTTSPSYIFLAAIEEALELGAKEGVSLTDQIVKKIPKSEYIYTFDDPFKLILNFSKKGFNGEYVLNILEKEFGIYCEMAQGDNVLLMTSWANTKDDFKLLENAIEHIKKLPDIKRKNTLNEFEEKLDSVSKFTPREVHMKEKELVDIEKAVGRIAAKEVTSFPPCIPYFMPGEVVSKDHINRIIDSIEKGIDMTGIENGKIMVVKE